MAIVVLAVLQRRVIVGRMDALRATMTADDAPASPASGACTCGAG